MKKISRFISLAVIISLISVPGNFAFAEDLHGQEKEKDKKQIVENSDSSLNQNEKPQNETGNTGDDKTSEADKNGSDESKEKSKEGSVLPGDTDGSSTIKKSRSRTEDSKKAKVKGVKKKKKEIVPVTPKTNNFSNIVNGQFMPNKFSAVSKGNKVKIRLLHITVNNRYVMATIHFVGKKWTRLDTNGKIYKGSVKRILKRGSTETEIVTSYEIPLRLNAENRLIAYDISGDKNIKNEITLKASMQNSKKLSDGIYKVKSDTDRIMFNMAPRESEVKYSALEVKNGRMFATISLTGTGYDYLFPGTTEQAKTAPKSKWVKGILKNGYLTYRIPVSLLDTKLIVSAHSRRNGEKNKAEKTKKYQEWFQHTVIFYSKGAKKTKTIKTPKKKTNKKHKRRNNKKIRNNGRKDRLSKHKPDSNKSTPVIDNSSKLKDGVYIPDSSSWSGGSGRLKYIKCTKVTITNGKAYGTVVFSSSYYDSLKANGQIFRKKGSGLSTFVIPIKLNANNTIIGRTTKMSQPHWIKYNLYVALSANSKGKKIEKEKKKATKESKFKMVTKAPAITGLKYKSTTKIKYAKYFKIFNYNHGVKLVAVDISKDTTLRTLYSKNVKKNNKNDNHVKYDEEGKAVAKSQHEITEALYHNNIINYLIVPKKFDLPAGLDKDYIIIRTPNKKTYVASDEALTFLDKIGATSPLKFIGIDSAKNITSNAIRKAYKNKKIKYGGSYKKPSYKKLILGKITLSILPSDMLPLDKKRKSGFFSCGEKNQKDNAELQRKQLEQTERRMTTLNISVIIDRSCHEKSKLAKAEWIKLYGAIYNKDKQAKKIFDKQVKKEKSHEK